MLKYFYPIIHKIYILTIRLKNKFHKVYKVHKVYILTIRIIKKNALICHIEKITK